MKNNQTLELAKYIYENYPGISSSYPFWKILSVIDRKQDCMVFIKDGSEIKGAALFLRLTDKSLEDLLMERIKFNNSFDMFNLMNEKGDNIHFIQALADGQTTLLRGLRKVIKKFKPTTVSWYKPDMKKIHIVYTRRAEICHK